MVWEVYSCLGGWKGTVCGKISVSVFPTLIWLVMCPGPIILGQRPILSANWNWSEWYMNFLGLCFPLLTYLLAFAMVLFDYFHCLGYQKHHINVQTREHFQYLILGHSFPFPSGICHFFWQDIVFCCRNGNEITYLFHFDRTLFSKESSTPCIIVELYTLQSTD